MTVRDRDTTDQERIPIADLVAALTANDYVTGEIVIADGGLNLT